MIVKITLLELALSLSTLPEPKTQCITHLSFNSILQLISGISIVHQKLLRYINGTAIAEFLGTLLLP